ncbi:hypothetical protein QEH56_04850 [Pelagicoccus enzymogenes]|uniref:hypothetical protein n=1 Tax=Pelagicoccus enzymogenes TaxID=2773457 RepID=UPI0028105E87|nr:hypothetical protein [Pelagicoccus enzymogenes]MDQ8197463.1 hypothetical protein [Pelagicoccus enzymogenes]
MKPILYVCVSCAFVVSCIGQKIDFDEAAARAPIDTNLFQNKTAREFATLLAQEEEETKSKIRKIEGELERLLFRSEFVINDLDKGLMRVTAGEIDPLNYVYESKKLAEDSKAFASRLEELRALLNERASKMRAISGEFELKSSLFGGQRQKKLTAAKSDLLGLVRWYESQALEIAQVQDRLEVQAKKGEALSSAYFQAALSGFPDPAGVGESDSLVKNTGGFPWPPPIASAWVEVPDNLINPNAIEKPTLGQINEVILSGFDESGYVEKSYYPIPDGFAVVTRLERINEDGTYKDEHRFDQDLGDDGKLFSIGVFFRRLLFAEKGTYRVVVLAVTSKSIAFSGNLINREDAQKWLVSGQLGLPDEIAQRSYSTFHSTVALIYEFKKTGSDKVILSQPSAIDGKQHLVGSELFFGGIE